MTIPLLKTSTLTITRPSEGYWNSSGEWVDGTASTFDIECNIQPFREGRERYILPEGITTEGAILVYSKTRLNTADQLTNTQGDLTVFDGFDYRCIKLENWNLYGLQVDHYKHVFVRKDNPTNGGL